MALSEFEVCIVVGGKPGPVTVVRADTTHPRVGESFWFGKTQYRVVDVHHHASRNERVPTDRARCFIVEITKPQLVSDDDPAPVDQPLVGQGQGKLVRFPSSIPSAPAADVHVQESAETSGEKRVRGAALADPYNAPTVRRDVSMSQVER